MKYSLLAMILAYNVCLGDDEIIRSINIRNCDNDTDILRHFYDSVPYYTIHPLRGYRIIKVVDDDQVLWTETDQSKPLRFMTLHFLDNEYKLIMIVTKRDHPSDDYYFELINGVWKSIDKGSYYSKENKITMTLSLDIRNYLHNFFRSVTYTKFGNSVASFSSIGHRRINEIVDGDFLIWKGDLNLEYTNNVVLHSRLGKQKLLSFVVRDQEFITDVCYREKGENGKWHEIEYDEYNKKSNRIECESRLDISSTIAADPFYYDITYNHPYGLPSIIYASKTYEITTEVREADLLIWESPSDDESCAYASIHFKDLVPILLQLHVETIDSHGDIFYEKADGIWNKVDCGEYYEKLERCDLEEDLKMRKERGAKQTLT